MRTAISAAVAALLASTAAVSAADLAVKARPIAPVPVFSWTGFYAGVNGGIGGNKVDYPFAVTGVTGGNLGLTSFGGFGGGQIGYNWQFAGNWVAGVETDIQGSAIKSELSGAINGLGSLSAGSEVKYFGTVRGRLGYAFDRVLVYGTGGFAYGSEDTTLSINPGLLSYKKSNDLTGWTAGAGVEVALINNLSFKTEYLYLKFDRNNVFSIAPVFSIDNKIDAHTLKFGLNYAFWK